MSKVLKILLITAAATGVAAIVLQQLDLDTVRDELSDEAPGFPGPDPDDLNEEDVANLLNELASQL